MSSESGKMAKNTLYMYFRMLFVIIIQLVSVPLVLRSLGVEDYGIYQVIGGFVLFFTFINGSLVSGCQRFLSFAIGTGSSDQLINVFRVSQTIFVVFAVICVILIEVLGLWFVNCKMNIPQERLMAANWVFQFSTFTFFVNVLSIPYSSSLVAHERLSVFAYISIVESILKLLISLGLFYVLKGDLLIIYGALMFLSCFIVFLLYRYYSLQDYRDNKKYGFYWDNNLVKDLAQFAGWNIVGAVALTLRNQGLNVLVNLFFTPVVNAAHAIAFNINGVFGQLANNVYMATRPQMVKKYADNHINEMWRIVFLSTKYSFFLLMIFAVPFIINAEIILKLWLHDVPKYSVQISQLVLLASLVEALSNQIIGAFQAMNKLKCYQSVSSVILLSLIPLSYLGLSILREPLLPYILFILISTCYVISIILIARKKIGLNIKYYSTYVLVRTLIPFLFSLAGSTILSHLFDNEIMNFILSTVLSVILSISIIWFWGLTINERNYILEYTIKTIKYQRNESS